MKTKILSILRNSNKYISGQQLCEALGVSRTAIWKVINQLKEEGYEIESITNKGYRIINYPDIVTKSEIESRVKTKIIGKQVVYYDEINSTNTAAKKTAENKDTDGVLVIAEEQTSGKGRRGREWSSPKGDGIWMSLILKPNINPRNASMLTLVTALAIVKSIRSLYQLDALIKWPNDIVIHGKKVCGILTEMSAELDYVNHIVIGMGINANTGDFQDELKDVATSLFLETNKRIVRAELIEEIMREFEFYYEIFLKKESLIDLVEEYNGQLVNYNNDVLVLEAGNSYKAHALGINAIGELIVRVEEGNDKGHIRTIISGEVSVRGIYGYV